MKVNVHGLVEILDEYEHELVNSKIMPLIPEAWHEEFRFLTFDPFADKDDAKFGKVNGRCIKLCDVMGAYLRVRRTRRIHLDLPQERQHRKCRNRCHGIQVQARCRPQVLS